MREQLDNLAKDISIHALHEESDRVGVHIVTGLHISIHALHEESDANGRLGIPYRHHFNPRSP